MAICPRRQWTTKSSYRSASRRSRALSFSRAFSSWTRRAVSTAVSPARAVISPSPTGERRARTADLAIRADGDGLTYLATGATGVAWAGRPLAGRPNGNGGGATTWAIGAAGGSGSTARTVVQFGHRIIVASGGMRSIA